MSLWLLMLSYTINNIEKVNHSVKRYPFLLKGSSVSVLERYSAQYQVCRVRICPPLMNL